MAFNTLDPQFQELCTRLCRKIAEGQITQEQLEGFMRLPSHERDRLAGIAPALVRGNQLLSHCGHTTVQCDGLFRAACFRVDRSRRASMPIAFINELFREWFLGGQEEWFEPVVTVYYDDLRYTLEPAHLVAELGGGQHITVSLPVLWGLLGDRHRSGMDGDRRKHLFHVADHEQTVRAVIVRWGVDGWHISAQSLEESDAWPVRTRVFSRSSPSMRPR